MHLLRGDLLHGHPLGQQEVEARLDVRHHRRPVLWLLRDVGHFLVGDCLDDFGKEETVDKLGLKTSDLVLASRLLQVVVGPVRVDLNNRLLLSTPSHLRGGGVPIVNLEHVFDRMKQFCTAISPVQLRSKDSFSLLSSLTLVDIMQLMESSLCPPLPGIDPFLSLGS